MQTFSEGIPREPLTHRQCPGSDNENEHILLAPHVTNTITELDYKGE